MAHQRMSRYGNRGSFEDQAEGRMRQAYGRAQDVIEANPGYSALACFGIGLCVGAGITLLMASPKREKAWYEHYLPADLSHGDVGRQVRDTVARMLPEAIARHMTRR
ncbi:MAG TPA: hypothetical protein VG826_08855 [Pirellulales bacterium]|nr:hypothetical protein [Pirellulales bacterium]